MATGFVSVGRVGHVNAQDLATPSNSSWLQVASPEQFKIIASQSAVAQRSPAAGIIKSTREAEFHTESSNVISANIAPPNSWLRVAVPGQNAAKSKTPITNPFVSRVPKASPALTLLPQSQVAGLSLPKAINKVDDKTGKTASGGLDFDAMDMDFGNLRMPTNQVAPSEIPMERRSALGRQSVTQSATQLTRPGQAHLSLPVPHDPSGTIEETLPVQPSQITGESSINATHRIGDKVGKTVAGGLNFDAMDFGDLQLPANQALPSSGAPGHQPSPSQQTTTPLTRPAQPHLSLPGNHNPSIADSDPLETGQAAAPSASPVWTGPSEVATPASRLPLDNSSGFDLDGSGEMSLPNTTSIGVPSGIVQEHSSTIDDLDGFSQAITPTDQTNSSTSQSSPAALIAPHVPRIPQLSSHNHHSPRLDSYRARAFGMQEAPTNHATSMQTFDASQIPANGFDMWWEHPMGIRLDCRIRRCPSASPR